MRQACLNVRDWLKGHPDRWISWKYVVDLVDFWNLLELQQSTFGMGKFGQVEYLSGQVIV